MSITGDITRGFASLSSSYLRVYENINYDSKSSLHLERILEPLPNTVLLEVPMLFATSETSVVKRGLLKTKFIHVLFIRSSIENVGIEVLFEDTVDEKRELQDWDKYVKEAEDINRRKVNRLNSARRKISEDRCYDSLRRKSSDESCHSETGNWLSIVQY